MTADELLARLRGKGIAVRADGSNIGLRPRYALTREDLEAVAAVKHELLQLLAGGVGDHPTPDTTGKVDLPALTVGPRHVAEALPFLSMPLDEFKRRGACLEVRVPWLNVTLWVVPVDRDVNMLMQEGISRGRIWTANELQQLISVASRTPETVQTLAHAKLELDGDIVEVRQRRP